MQPLEPNPFAAPNSEEPVSKEIGGDLRISPKDDSSIRNVIRDSRLALLSVFIPILAIVLLLPLVRWHQLRNQIPSLTTSESGQLGESFRSARWRLWFGVMIWPVVFIIAWVAIGLG